KNLKVDPNHERLNANSAQLMAIRSRYVRSLDENLMIIVKSLLERTVYVSVASTLAMDLLNARARSPAQSRDVAECTQKLSILLLQLRRRLERRKKLNLSTKEIHKFRNQLTTVKGLLVT